MLVNKGTINFCLPVEPHSVSLNGQGEFWQIVENKEMSSVRNRLGISQSFIKRGVNIFWTTHTTDEGQWHTMELPQFYYLQESD